MGNGVQKGNVIVGSRGMSSGDQWWTLEDFVMDLFDRNQTHSPEFQTMLNLYGKEKIHSIYAKYVELKNSSLK